MICTKNLASDYKEVDTRWIFKYYCGIQENLEGQDVKIKSMFNPKERTPSMVIGIPKNKEEYAFKCFSTGKSGSAVGLVMALFDLPFHKAANKVVEDYNEYVLKNGCDFQLRDFKRHSRYQVVDFKVRDWINLDKNFWLPYNIGTRLLNKYQVKPLSSYLLKKEVNGVPHELDIQGYYIYGYFTKEGALHKIYQPKVQDKKFIKVKDFIQGSEQLQGHNCLIILSGLKDVMSFDSLGMKVDVIAGSSELTPIAEKDIIEYKKKYKHILTLFDQDTAGLDGAAKYKELYGIDSVYIITEPVIKDVADLLKNWGPKRCLEYFVPKIQNLIDSKSNF